LIILWREVGNRLKLVTRNPAEVALLAEMLTAVCRASINAYEELRHIRATTRHGENGCR
jgi:hypothetical protein